MARWQLTALRISGSAISWRTRRGRLHVIRAGVYAVAGAPCDQSATLVAALLSLPRGSVTSHRAAAAMHRLSAWTGYPEVTVPRSVSRRRGLIIHRASLPPDEVMQLRGIPVTKRGLPRFVQQHPVAVGGDRHRLDIAWPERMIAVELDTPAGHDHPEAIERDKRRDRRLRGAGWTVLRVTSRAFETDRVEIEADLRAALVLALPRLTTKARRSGPSPVVHPGAGRPNP